MPDTVELDRLWSSWFEPSLAGFISIPNLSPDYDANFLTNGHIESAIEHIHTAATSLDIDGLTRTLIRLEGDDAPAPPLIVYSLPASEPNAAVGSVMLYGHLDKQPHMERWDEGKGPTVPVFEDGRLFGRGGADDGYAAFLALLSIKLAQLRGDPLPQISIVLECEEESGSPSLTRLIAAARAVCLPPPDLCLCIDSSCPDYSSLWLTSSLRGIAEVTFAVRGGAGPLHSGQAGGAVPETFRAVRTILDRIDDPQTGAVVRDPAFYAAPPKWKRDEAKILSGKLGRSIFEPLELVDGASYVLDEEDESGEHSGDPVKMYLNKTWNPTVAIIGMDGIPSTAEAGSVLRPETKITISMRVPPTINAKAAAERMRDLALEEDQGATGCRVTEEGELTHGNGWIMKPLDARLAAAVDAAGKEWFDGKKPGSFGEGASIPFLNELQGIFPAAQIVAMGVLGPQSNAHAPNESIHLGYAKKLAGAVSSILSACGKPEKK